MDSSTADGCNRQKVKQTCLADILSRVRISEVYRTLTDAALRRGGGLAA